MRNKTKLVVVFVITVVVGVGIYFFSKPAKKEQVSNIPQTKTIVIGGPSPSTFSLLVDIIKSQGYDKEHNVDIVYKNIQPSELALGILNEEIDIGSISPILTAKLRAEGRKLRIFAPSLKLVGPFLVRADSPYKSIEDLRGEKIGTLGPGSGTYPNLVLSFSEQGEKLEEYFNVSYASMPALPTLLLSGKVEAMAGADNLILFAKLFSGDKVKVVGYTDNILKENFGKDFQTLLVGMAGREDWIMENQELLKDFLLMQDKAKKYLVENPEVLNQEEIKKKYEFGDEEIESMYKFIEDTEYFEIKDWDELTKDLEMVIQKAADNGLIPEESKENSNEVFFDLSAVK